MRHPSQDSILFCDPVVETVFKGNLLPLRDLRAVERCTKSQELHNLIQSRARTRLRRSTRSLEAVYRAGGILSSRMRGLIFEIETRLSEAGVAQKSIHPSLATPLCPSGFVAPAVIYGEVGSLAQAVRLISHPSAWASSSSNAAAPLTKLWDLIATSASVTMRPCLVLILALIIPVEARLANLTLRHSAYASSDVSTLGSMVARILATMMTTNLGPKDQSKVAKTLRTVAPTLEPLSLYVLRMCRKGVDRTNAQRVTEKAALEASLAALFEEHGDSVLYSPSVWVPWLLDQDESHLVALYIKYLFDGFQ